MSETSQNIWILALVGSVLAALPCLIWMIRAAIRRRWKQLGLLLLAPFLVFGAIWGITRTVIHFDYAKYLGSLFDVKTAVEKPIFIYDSPRALNGDGYSIAVYELPPMVRERFEHVDCRLLTEYPIMPSNRSHWTREHWRRGPLDARFDQYLQFALSETSREAPGLSSHLDDIRQALTGRECYYAFFYFRHGTYLGNIELFVIDLAANRLYLINSNT